MRIVEYTDDELSGSLLVVGFPSRGLVGPIVAAYVIEELGMWPVAGVVSDHFPPTVSVLDGMASPPVQFFASAEQCGPDGKCDKLIVLNAEIPVEPDQAHAFADAVLSWASRRGIRHVVTIEGIELEDEKGKPVKEPRLFGIASKNGDLSAQQLHLKPMPDGVITSHSSAFLLGAREREMDILSLIVAASEDADQLAAAEALLRIDPLVPRLNLGSQEFKEKVRVHRGERRRRRHEQAKQMKDMRRTYEMMYQ